MNKTHFHKTGFALGHVLKVRVFGTRKWPIGVANGPKNTSITKLFFSYSFTHVKKIISKPKKNILGCKESSSNDIRTKILLSDLHQLVIELVHVMRNQSYQI